MRKLKQSLIFGVLVAMVFGQIPGWLMQEWWRLPLRVHPLDVLVVGLAGVELVSGKGKYPNWFEKFGKLCGVGLFSLVFSLTMFEPSEILVGSLYWVRFLSYGTLGQVVFRGVKEKWLEGSLVVDSLACVGMAVAVLGIIGYLWLPDLRTLKLMGWDDHYYRLVSTFLDPGFAGIILVLGAVLVGLRYVREGKAMQLGLTGVMLGGLALTYSRASYLALGAVLGYWMVRVKEGRRRVLGLGLGMGVMILVLPRPGGEGVKLARTSSVAARWDNYRQSVQLIAQSPLFGVGYNNLCMAKGDYWEGEIGEHACGGLDNGLMMLWATMGVIGVMIALELAGEVWKTTGRDFYGEALRSSLVAVGVHGMFVNSWFYAWVMAWLAVLVGVSRGTKDCS